MEVIVVFKAPHDASNFRIIEVDHLHGTRLKKQIDQFGRGLAVILGIGPFYGQLPSVLTDRPDVHIQATLVAFVRIKFSATGQADVFEANLAWKGGRKMATTNRNSDSHDDVVADMLRTDPEFRTAILVEVMSNGDYTDMLVLLRQFLIAKRTAFGA
jgi:hypothetical protein